MGMPRKPTGSRGWLPLTDQWDHVMEAYSFWLLVQNGQCSPFWAKRDISMTKNQRASLMSRFPADRLMIQAIYRRRRLTMQAFDAFLLNPKVAMKLKESLAGGERGRPEKLIVLMWMKRWLGGARRHRLN